MENRETQLQFIRVSDLSKHFEEVTAVNGISFTISKGELFGFLGPNGAGKTTTINMLTGLAKRDSSMIQIAGFDCSSLQST
ncbi:MAG: ATP-binding cassette domain-containing protein [Bacteroidales bacterium]